MSDALSRPEAFRTILEAEAEIAKAAIAADFVDLWNTEPCPILQRHFAEQYRKMMGVDPSQHEELTAALRQITRTGEGTVAGLRELLSQTPPLPGSLETRAAVPPEIPPR